MEGLVWLPERGMGWYPVTDAPYDADYFAKYEGYAATEMGAAITAARVALVDRWAGPGARVVDVGIGCGDFVRARPGTYGFDINPAGVCWLKDRWLWLDPYEQPVDAATFWDCLEHIADPAPLLANVRGWVFVSLPIVPGGGPPPPDWRHLRRDEHCWYWTHEGFVGWMAAHGWELLEHSRVESDLGRQDIGTYAFRRAG